ncbi:hypothetical protein ACSNN8_13770 [Actinoplanes sp. URMC 104]
MDVLNTTLALPSFAQPATAFVTGTILSSPTFNIVLPEPDAMHLA